MSGEVREGGAAAGDDALLDRGEGGVLGVLDAELAVLELGLGGGANLDDGDAAGELGDALGELLGVVDGVCVSASSLLELRDANVDLVAGRGVRDEGGGVVRDGHLAGVAEGVEGGGRWTPRPRSFARKVEPGDDGDVLEEGLAALAESGGLDRGDVEDAAELVDDEGGEGLAG